MENIFTHELSRYSTIIVGNGEVPQGEIPMLFLQHARFIVCCDGALEKLLKIGMKPDVVIGDCDSISEDRRQQFKDIIIEDKDQECNDLQKALKYCLRQQFGPIAILGASGLRDDHQLANLSILNMYAERMDLIMVSNYGLFSFISEDTTFASTPGQEVSVFSFDGQALFSFSGLQYPVHNRRFAQLWEGSLNKALGNSFTITLNNGRGVVFREFCQLAN
ncbi:MAG: thiamine diphosphokinase [Bacteroidetes bacterium]|nr:thiamine diphosphokinase [Bacteroidota bacterium]MBQ9509254.1 thiamine diphosphokinase [Bacteroidales bacterium]